MIISIMVLVSGIVEAQSAATTTEGEIKTFLTQLQDGTDLTTTDVERKTE